MKRKTLPPTAASAVALVLLGSCPRVTGTNALDRKAAAGDAYGP